jgi:hypothetical protein
MFLRERQAFVTFDVLKGFLKLQKRFLLIEPKLSDFVAATLRLRNLRGPVK